MCMKGNNSISVILPFYNNRQTAKENREYASAFVYNETYLQLRDSIEHLYRPDELERVKALYNKERMQNRHDRQI